VKERITPPGTIVEQKGSIEDFHGGRIVTCVGTQEDFSRNDSWPVRQTDTVLVDYYGNNDETWTRLKQKSAGRETYVISALDSFNKESRNYADCTGIVAVGVDKETGENISFLTHQDGKKILTADGPLKEVHEQFIADLRASLSELKDRSKTGSIDLVIFGGWAEGFGGGFYPYSAEEYKRSVQMIGNLCEEVLQIDPDVAIGPNAEPTRDGYDEHGNGTIRDFDVQVVFDTINRRLYMVRPEQPTGPSRDPHHPVEQNTNRTFKASQIEEEEKYWTDSTWQD